MNAPVCRAWLAPPCLMAGQLVGLFVVLGSACVQDKKAAPLPGNLLADDRWSATAWPTSSAPPTVWRRWRVTSGTPGITAEFSDPQGQVTWDLGSSKTIEPALVQGDNNDDYILSGSADGKTFAPLWQSAPADGPGMRMRQTTFRVGTAGTCG